MPRKLSEMELDFIREHYDTMPAAAIAERLVVTEASVHGAYKRLKASALRTLPAPSRSAPYPVRHDGKGGLDADDEEEIRDRVAAIAAVNAASRLLSQAGQVLGWPTVIDRIHDMGLPIPKECKKCRRWLPAEAFGSKGKWDKCCRCKTPGSTMADFREGLTENRPKEVYQSADTAKLAKNLRRKAEHYREGLRKIAKLVQAALNKGVPREGRVFLGKSIGHFIVDELPNWVKRLIRQRDFYRRQLKKDGRDHEPVATDPSPLTPDPSGAEHD